MKLPVIPTLRPSLSPIRTRKPLLFHLHTQGQLLLAALSYPLLYFSASQTRPDYGCCPVYPPDQPLQVVVAAAAALQRVSRLANKSRCSLTAFRVCIRCLHISLRKTPHNGLSRHPSSSASLATWYALFFAKRFSPLHMSICPPPLPCPNAHHWMFSGHDFILTSPMLNLPLSGPLPVVITSRCTA